MLDFSFAFRTPAIPGGGFNWLPQRLWGILRATWFFLHIIIQTFVFADCPSSSNPAAKNIELRTVKDLSLAERCPAVKIMSLEEAYPGIWRWWIHDRTTNGLGFHFGGQMVLVIEIRHLHIMAPSYMIIPDSVFTGSSWRPPGPWFQHEFWMSSWFLPWCFWCLRVPQQKLPVT